jgi:hypothetical protein
MSPYRSARRQVLKRFDPGQVVMVRRSPGQPWEPAIYREKYADWRGWHRVELKDEPRRVDSQTGMDATPDNPRAYLTPMISVPTQRIRPRRPDEEI